jgi:hypothetical protein
MAVLQFLRRPALSHVRRCSQKAISVSRRFWFPAAFGFPLLLVFRCFWFSAAFGFPLLWVFNWVSFIHAPPSPRITAELLLKQLAHNLSGGSISDGRFLPTDEGMVTSEDPLIDPSADSTEGANVKCFI